MGKKSLPNRAPWREPLFFTYWQRISSHKDRFALVFVNEREQERLVFFNAKMTKDKPRSPRFNPPQHGSFMRWYRREGLFLPRYTCEVCDGLAKRLKAETWTGLIREISTGSGGKLFEVELETLEKLRRNSPDRVENLSGEARTNLGESSGETWVSGGKNSGDYDSWVPF